MKFQPITPIIWTHKIEKTIDFYCKTLGFICGEKKDDWNWASLHKDDCWNKLNENDLHMMIEKSDKKRHEISAGKIRAVYGHSTQQRISKEAAIPPKILYHGTASRFMVKIMKKGLLPQERQYVHLSSDVETAILVGQRREDKPVLLKINALEAWNEGIKFYFANEKIWLADYIPNKYISI